MMYEARSQPPGPTGFNLSSMGTSSIHLLRGPQRLSEPRKATPMMGSYRSSHTGSAPIPHYPHSVVLSDNPLLSLLSTPVFEDTEKPNLTTPHVLRTEKRDTQAKSSSPTMEIIPSTSVPRDDSSVHTPSPLSYPTEYVPSRYTTTLSATERRKTPSPPPNTNTNIHTPRESFVCTQIPTASSPSTLITLADTPSQSPPMSMPTLSPLLQLSSHNQSQSTSQDTSIRAASVRAPYQSPRIRPSISTLTPVEKPSYSGQMTHSNPQGHINSLLFSQATLNPNQIHPTRVGVPKTISTPSQTALVPVHDPWEGGLREVMNQTDNPQLFKHAVDRTVTRSEWLQAGIDGLSRSNFRNQNRELLKRISEATIGLLNGLRDDDPVHYKVSGGKSQRYSKKPRRLSITKDGFLAVPNSKKDLNPSEESDPVDRQSMPVPETSRGRPRTSSFDTGGALYSILHVGGRYVTRSEAYNLPYGRKGDSQAKMKGDMENVRETAFRGGVKLRFYDRDAPVRDSTLREEWVSIAGNGIIV